MPKPINNNLEQTNILGLFFNFKFRRAIKKFKQQKQPLINIKTSVKILEKTLN